MLSFGSFSTFKNISGKAIKTSISLEQEEKNDSESEDLKLAILNENNLKLAKILKAANLENDLEIFEFTAETPTSPPNC